MTRPVITVDAAARGICQACTAQVLVRVIHLGPIEIKACPVCRVGLREALARAAGETRDALRADAAEAVA